MRPKDNRVNEPRREIYKPVMFFEKLDMLKLFRRRGDRLLLVGDVAVHNPVNIIA